MLAGARADTRLIYEYKTSNSKDPKSRYSTGIDFIKYGFFVKAERQLAKNDKEQKALKAKLARLDVAADKTTAKIKKIILRDRERIDGYLTPAQMKSFR